MGVNKATKTHDPLWVGQQILRLILMSKTILSDPQGVDNMWVSIIPLVVQALPSDTGATTNRASARSLHHYSQQLVYDHSC